MSGAVLLSKCRRLTGTLCVCVGGGGGDFLNAVVMVDQNF